MELGQTLNYIRKIINFTLFGGAASKLNIPLAGKVI